MTDPGDELLVRDVPDGALYSDSRFSPHSVYLDGLHWRVSDDHGLWYPANTASTLRSDTLVTIVSLGWTRAKLSPRALERSALKFWRDR